MKKKRISAVLFAVLICTLSFAGCKKNVGTPEDNPVKNEDTEENNEEEEVQSHSYGFSGITMKNPYFITLEKAIEEEVVNNGDTLMVKDPDNNVDTQIQQIQEMIDEGIELLFLSPVDWEKITPALEALKEADVRVVNVDTQVKDMDLVDAFIGSDNSDAGYQCGEDLVEKFPDGGKIAILECTTMNSMNDRITGFEEAIAGKGFEVVAREDTLGDMQLSIAAAEKILNENDDIVAIMCGNDQAALGALVAVKEKTGCSTLIYGVDGSPDIKKELKKVNSLVEATSGQSPINMGKNAAKIARNIINGEKYEKETYEETFLITKENVDMYGVDGWQ